jgi:hypothetical protein
VTAQQSFSTQAISETLRPLSPYERLFLIIDQINVFNFSVAVSFRGTVDRAGWSAAFAKVQERHPLLNACLNLDDPSAPAFVRTDALPVSLEFRQRTSPTQWQRVMEAGYVERFDPSLAPQVRAVMLEDGAGCDLVVTANHIFIDGIGIVALIRDVLAALSGEKLTALPLPPSAEERVAQAKSTSGSQSAESAKAFDKLQETIAALPERPFARRTNGGKPTIEALRLSVEQSEALLRCCRRQKTTIGAVLLAALECGLRRLSPELSQANLHLRAPVDARPYLNNPDDYVLSIGLARAVSLYPPPDLWESARALRTQLVAFQAFVEIEAEFERAQGALALNLEPVTLVDILASKHGFDVMLSNLKCADFPKVPDGLAVEAVWGPSVLVGFAGEHVVGSATFGGALHLVYTSHSPVAGLLESVQQIVADACAEG